MKVFRHIKPTKKHSFLWGSWYILTNLVLKTVYQKNVGFEVFSTSFWLQHSNRWPDRFTSIRSLPSALPLTARWGYLHPSQNIVFSFQHLRLEMVFCKKHDILEKNKIIQNLNPFSFSPQPPFKRNRYNFHLLSTAKPHPQPTNNATFRAKNCRSLRSRRSVLGGSSSESLRSMAAEHWNAADGKELSGAAHDTPGKQRGKPRRQRETRHPRSKQRFSRVTRCS